MQDGKLERGERANHHEGPLRKEMLSALGGMIGCMSQTLVRSPAPTKATVSGFLGQD